MTGVTLRLDDGEVRAALNRLAGLARPRAVLSSIGEQIVESTRDRFRREVAPDGTRWAALNPAYAAGKRGGGILRQAGMAGGLMGSLHYRADDTSVEVGTNKTYAAVHQFGAVIRPVNAEALAFSLGGASNAAPVFAQSVTIPARPFLGLSDQDRAEILAVLEEHIEDVLARAR